MIAAVLAALLASCAAAAGQGGAAPRLPDLGASLHAAASASGRLEKSARAGLELQNAISGGSAIASKTAPVPAASPSGSTERHLAPSLPGEAPAAKDVPPPVVPADPQPKRQRVSAAFEALVLVALIAASAAAGVAAYDSFSEIARIGEAQLRGNEAASDY